MTMKSSPPSACRRRARLRRSRMERPGVSSIKMWASSNLAAASHNRFHWARELSGALLLCEFWLICCFQLSGCGQSEWTPVPDPAARVFMSVSASVQSIRCTSWSLLISRLKKATRLGASFSFAPRRATFWAMFKARAVFPMEGRAARIMKSEG